MPGKTIDVIAAWQHRAFHQGSSAMPKRRSKRTKPTSATRRVFSNYLSVAPNADDTAFVVLLPDQHPLKTPGGRVVTSENHALLLHMVRELEAAPVLHVSEGIIVAPRPLSAYLLYATEHDAPPDCLKPKQTETILRHDPILQPSAGPEWTD
jgi:hypothetical protein